MPERTDLVLGLKGDPSSAVATLEKIVKALDRLDKKLDRVGTEAENTAKRFETGFARAAQRMSSSIGRMVKYLVAGAGVGLVGSFYKAIGAAREFETALGEVSTLLGGKAVQQMAKYRKEIIELSKRSSSGANELTRALYQVISAGTKGSQTVAGAMKLLETAQHAAVAGVSDTFTAVDVLTTALNAYGKSTEDAERFSDSLFVAVREGKLTFGELASQLGMVASIAANAGVSFEEVNAAVAAMTKAGLSTDIAVTALRGTLVSLMKPSKDLKAVLGDPAKTLRERGLLGAMELIGKAAAGDSAKMSKLIPDVRALTGASILAGTGLQNFRDIMEKMGESTGAMDTAYRKMSDTFEEQTRRFWNTVNAAFIEIGSRLMPVLMEYMEKFSAWFAENGDEVIDWITKAVETMVEFGKWVLANGKTIVTILASMWAVGKITAFVGVLRTAVGLYKDLAKIPMTGALGLMTRLAAAAAPAALMFGAWSKTASAIQEAKAAGKAEAAKLAAGYAPAVRIAAPALAGMSPEQLAGLRGGTAPYEYLFGQVKGQYRRLTGYGATYGMEQKLRKELDRLIADMTEQAAQRGAEAVEQAVEKGAEAGAPEAAKVLSKEEKKRRKELLAARKSWAQLLSSLEMSLSTRRQRLELRFAEELKRVRTLAAKAGKDAAVAEGMLREKFERDLQKLREADRKRQLEHWQKVIDRFQRQQKIWREIEASAAAGISGWYGKIGGAELETEQERRFYRLAAGRKKEGGGFWSDVWRGAKERGGAMITDAAMAAAGGIMRPFGQIWDLLGSAMGGEGVSGTRQMVGGIVQGWENLARNLGPVLDYLAEEGIPKLLSAFVDALPEVIDAIVSHVDDIVVAVVDRVPDIIDAVIEQIPNIIQEIIRSIPIIAWELAKAVAEAIGNIVTLGGGLGYTKKWGGKVPVLGHAAGFVADIGKGAWGFLKGLFSKHGGGVVGEFGRTGLGGILPGVRAYHSGGIVGVLEGFVSASDAFVGAVRAHSGMFVRPRLAADEVPVIAQAGEGIIRRSVVEALGGAPAIEALNRGVVPGGDVHYHVHAGTLFARDAAEIVDELQAENFRRGKGRLRDSVITGVPGFESRRK